MLPSKNLSPTLVWVVPKLIPISSFPPPLPTTDSPTPSQRRHSQVKILIEFPVAGVVPIPLQHFLSPMPAEIGMLVRAGVQERIHERPLCRANIAPLTETRPVQPTVASRFALPHPPVCLLEGLLCATKGIPPDSFAVLFGADAGLELGEAAFFLFDSRSKLLTGSFLLAPGLFLSLLGQVLLALSSAFLAVAGLSLALAAFADLASEALELFALGDFLAAALVLVMGLFLLSLPHSSCDVVFVLGTWPHLLSLSLLPVLFLALASGFFSKALSAVESGLFS